MPSSKVQSLRLLGCGQVRVLHRLGCGQVRVLHRLGCRLTARTAAPPWSSPPWASPPWASPPWALRTYVEGRAMNPRRAQRSASRVLIRVDLDVGQAPGTVAQSMFNYVRSKKDRQGRI